MTDRPMADYRALPPTYSEHRNEWIVGLKPIRDGQTFVHGHASFSSEDEAAAFVAKTNGAVS